jgi:transposase
MARSSPYPTELRNHAVRMVAEVRPDYPSEWSAMKAVSAKLGVTSAETVRGWVRQAEVSRPRINITRRSVVVRLQPPSCRTPIDFRYQGHLHFGLPGAGQPPPCGPAGLRPRCGA